MEMRFQRDDQCGDFFAGQFHGGFVDRVSGDTCHQLRNSLTTRGHEIKDLSHPDKAVAYITDSRIDWAAIPFAAENGIVCDHGVGNIGFADGAQLNRAAVLLGDVGGHSAGRTIGDDDPLLLGRSQDVVQHKSQRVLFADVLAPLVNNRQAVGVRVLAEDDVGTELNGSLGRRL